MVRNGCRSTGFARSATQAGAMDRVLDTRQSIRIRHIRAKVPTRDRPPGQPRGIRRHDSSQETTRSRTSGYFRPEDEPIGDQSDQTRGGWKMDDPWLAGLRVGSSAMPSRGDAEGRMIRTLKAPHWSVPSATCKVVGTGIGTRFEQPGPEQLEGRFGPGSAGGLPYSSSDTEASRSTTMSGSRRPRLESRSDFATTRWLQPAQADRGAPRPWIRSSISAPTPHLVSRSKRMGLITPSTRGESHRPGENLPRNRNR